MRVLLQGLDGLLDIADIPKLDFAVISAAGKIVLAIGIEVQVTYKLAMGILYTVDLTETERQREMKTGKERIRLRGEDGKHKGNRD